MTAELHQKRKKLVICNLVSCIKYRRTKKEKEKENNKKINEQIKNKLKVIVPDPLKERSHFTFFTLRNKYHDFFNTSLKAKRYVKSMEAEWSGGGGGGGGT